MNDELSTLLNLSMGWALGLGYLFGSIPFGLVLTRRLLKTDIRTIGSGNIGATNVLRTGNKALSFWTLVLDMAKGSVPVLIAGFSWFPGHDTYAPFYAAAGAVLGHVFPVWLRFKGGKGVASYFGTLLALNLWVGLTTLAFWLGTVRATRISSLGALVATFCTPFLVFFLTHRQDFVIYTVVLGLLVIARHARNIQRLLNHTEPTIHASGKNDDD